MKLRPVAQVHRAWLIVISSIVLVAVLTGAFGGFRAALDVGRPGVVGEEVQLNRWVIAVQGAEYSSKTLNGVGSDPVVRVRLRFTNTTDATIFSFPDRMVTVRVGAVELVKVATALGQQRSGYSYDPDVAVTLAFDFEWAATPDPPRIVTVVLRDERERRNFVYGTVWSPDVPAALVETPCPDLR